VLIGTEAARGRTLPLRQLVHARAPRLGMCPERPSLPWSCVSTIGLGGTSPSSVRRRLCAWCSEDVEVAGEWDILEGKEAAAGRVWRAHRPGL
jgi:hypothetical protein